MEGAQLAQREDRGSNSFPLLLLLFDPHLQSLISLIAMFVTAPFSFFPPRLFPSARRGMSAAVQHSGAHIDTWKTHSERDTPSPFLAEVK